MRNCLLSLLSQFSSPPSLSGPHSPPSPPPPPPQLSVVERDFHSHFILFNWMHVSKGNVWQVFLATRFGARRLNGVLNSNYTCPPLGVLLSCLCYQVVRLHHPALLMDNPQLPPPPPPPSPPISRHLPMATLPFPPTLALPFPKAAALHRWVHLNKRIYCWHCNLHYTDDRWEHARK